MPLGNSGKINFMNMAGFYNGKKVFITGHTGFKGGWLSLWLSKLGADVCGYSLEPNTEPNFFSITGLSMHISRHYIGDVLDIRKLTSAMNEFSPEIVFHLAAQPLVRDSYDNPKYTYDVNVMGTLNLLEAVRQVDSVKAVVVITTDKCYENKEWEYGYREIDPLGGYDPYSSSKACADILTNSYYRSFLRDRAVSTVRAGNVIGGGDWGRDRIVPDCIRALSENMPINIRNPQGKRPWQFVLEPLYGYMLLAQNMWDNPKEFSSAWNFGPYNNAIIPVEEIVNMVIKKWGEGKFEIKINKDKEKHEADVLILNIDKAVSRLKWQPVLTIEQGISMAIDWYRAFYNKNENMFAFTIDQIEMFEKRIRNA